MSYGNGLVQNYGGYSTSSLQQGAGMGIWILISFLAALIGCFVVYFVFVVKKDKPKGKFLAWLKSFLTFDYMLIEPILKILYIFAAIFATLSSLALFGLGFVGFLLFIPTLGLSNVIVRLLYEAALMKVMIWKNTTEIKNKLK